MPKGREKKGKQEVNILLAGPRGFCAGVVRAIEVVEAALKRNGGQPVYVRHEIVHNRHVVERLEEMGAIFVDELADVPDGAIVIFSAHGVAKAVVDQAGSRALVALDATCPLVSKVHQEAQNHHRRGSHVLLIGHAGHPEVVGTMGQVPAEAITLVQDLADAETLTVPDPANLAYTTQTTLSVDDTASIIETLKRRFPTIQGPNKADICYATTNRQEAVKAIAPRVDAMIVVGAPNSSNSNRLVETARASGCDNAFLLENVLDLDWQLLEGVRTIGITAGASAPESLVEELVDTLSQRFKTSVEEITVRQEDVIFSIPKALVG